MRELADPLLWRRKGSAVLPADEYAEVGGGAGKAKGCPQRAGRACERHARGWVRFCKGRNVSIVSLGVLFYAVHLVVFVAVVVLFGTYRWPQTPVGWMTARENASLCTELNLLTTSYYCNASMYANRSVIPFGFVAGCSPGSTQCSTQLHTRPCSPGSTGRVVITQPNATASPLEYTVVFRGTEEKAQWRNNDNWVLVPWFGLYRDVDEKDSSQPHVSEGFFSEYRLVAPGVTARLMEEVGAHRARLFPANDTAGADASLASMRGFGPANITLTVLGHSLGCPLATMFALDAENQGFTVRRVLLVSPPRLGNAAMARLLERRLAGRATMLMNSLDLVLSGPPVWDGYQQPNLRVALVSYHSECMHCLRSLWLSWPWATSCGELCRRPPASMAWYQPQDVTYFLNSLGGSFSKLVEDNINHDGQWTRHRSFNFADYICPTVGRNAVLWPPKKDQHPRRPTAPLRNAK